MTPLGAEVAAIIADGGPIGVDRFMSLALGHPAFGYYRTRDPLGASGDFTTAPETSQMFGELIGAWAATVWLTLGAPAPVRLVELGPGRGTLLADALRAARRLPAFFDAIDLHLVETSPVFREAQRARLAACGRPTTWHEALDAVPQGPALVLANEFFDALPVRHFVHGVGGWHERLVGLNPASDALAFGLAPEPERAITLAAPHGAVLEIGLAGQMLAKALAARLVRDGGAALVIDYGYTVPAFAETLQATKQHRFVDPLAEPGEADLTAHVDFAGLTRAARAVGARVHGPVPQGRFLRDLGIGERAATLKRHATAAQAEDLDDALARLVEAGTPRAARHGRVVQGPLHHGAGGPEPSRLPDAGRHTGGRTMILAPITSRLLVHPGIAHGFFTRIGGVSTGLYASLNGGTGSRDDRAAVMENRRRMAEALGVAADRLVMPHLVHSPDAVIVTGPFTDADRPRCDGLATRTPHVALGVTGADCGTVLFADAAAGVVGACHAGWKGAFTGVIESTVEAMLSLGAEHARIVAALGPTIGQASYEVGPEFKARFIEADSTYAAFFAASARPDHHLFDLPGFIGHRARRAGVGCFEDLALDTYADDARFYSYRRATHHGEADYGRLVAAIALRPIT